MTSSCKNIETKFAFIENVTKLNFLAWKKSSINHCWLASCTEVTIKTYTLYLFKRAALVNTKIFAFDAIPLRN